VINVDKTSKRFVVYQAGSQDRVSVIKEKRIGLLLSDFIDSEPYGCECGILGRVKRVDEEDESRWRFEVYFWGEFCER